MLCAVTGELIYEPSHPWLEQVRCHLLKKWTWINKGEFLPTALTVFHLHVEVNRQPLDDFFQCLSHSQRLWSLLSKYYPPSFLYNRQGTQVHPLLLGLQAGDGGAARTDEGFSLLSLSLMHAATPTYRANHGNPHSSTQSESKTRMRYKICL